MVPANSTVVVTISKINQSTRYAVKLLYINEERRCINVAAKLDVESKVMFNYPSYSGQGRI
jgi:ABC-type cobalamin/Fe3+-siderophores transport system ATPase subunit